MLNCIRSVLAGTVALALLSACGGGSGNASGGGAAPPLTGSGSKATIGAAGGTVSEAGGARVEIPAGALAQNTLIGVEQSSSGAPALPSGMTAYGPIVAFTPHGTSFAAPVTITVPFDPAKVPSGATVALFKTNAAQSAWDEVPGATVTGSTMSGTVTGFSYVTVSESAPTEKTWLLKTLHYDGDSRVQQKDEHADPVTGPVHQGFEAGDSLEVKPTGYPNDKGGAIVDASNSGRVFWAQAVAPRNVVNSSNAPSKPLGSSAYSKLAQDFYFKADQDHPTLHFTITHARLEAMDYGGNAPSPQLCPWMHASPTPEEMDGCVDTMSEAALDFTLEAASLVDGGTYFSTGGDVTVNGHHGDWRPYTLPMRDRALWNDSYFTFNADVDGNGSGNHFQAELKQPRTVDIPIQHLVKDDVFMVTVTVEATASNRIQGESFVGAIGRDPVSDVGIQFETTGLTPIAPRHDIPRAAIPIACSTGPDPASGQLQFTQTAVATAEARAAASLVVERIGGTTGPVSVRLTTRDGSASAGNDYEAVDTIVHFADGEGGQRLVSVPLLDDDLAETDETVAIELGEIGGCAELGAQSSATLTIWDEDQLPPPPPTHTVGGTIAGLAGSGLVVQDAISGASVDGANGPFTLPASLTDGATYNIVIGAPPTNPTQSCSVTNGVGTIAGSDVTNVQVTCSSAAPSGSLDTSFGDNGRAVTDVRYSPGVVGARAGMALQADGKILLVGGLKLLRFNADGTLDMTFGSGGKVDVPFANSVFDTAQDVAVEPDGKIVVVGLTSINNQDDFALARFNTDGALDAGFGTGGIVTTDFFGSTDRARRVRIQADGRIIAVGFATRVFSPTSTGVDFAIARYNPDGSLDADFANQGKAVDSPFAAYSLAQGVAIQADGKIVLAGSTANDGATDPDTGLVRYWGDGGFGLPGWRDLTFGETSNGVSHAALGSWDEAVDVTVLANEDIVTAERIRVGSTFQFALAHFGPEGHAPQGAVVFTSFSDQSDSPRAMLQQSDGKIVVVGQAASLGANPDMAIVRFAETALSYDTSFGTDGKLTLDFFGGIDSAEAVVQQPDGKLIIGGYARVNGASVLVLARFQP